MDKQTIVIVNHSYTGNNKHLIGHQGRILSHTSFTEHPYIVYFDHLFQYEAFKKSEIDVKIKEVTK